MTEALVALGVVIVVVVAITFAVIPYMVQKVIRYNEEQAEYDRQRAEYAKEWAEYQQRRMEQEKCRKKSAGGR